MADRARAGRPELRAVSVDDRDDHAGEQAGGGAAPELPAGSDRDGNGDPGASEAARRLANSRLLTEALEGLRNSNFAILKELRNGRKYRKQNPPKLELGLEWACEQCGTSRRSFDDLVHHQMTEHPETFLEGELPLGTPPCLCRSCDPAAWIDWQRTPEARGAK